MMLKTFLGWIRTKTTAGLRTAMVERDRKHTIRASLVRLRQMCPKKKGLQLYATPDDLKAARKRAMLYTYIRSADNTYAVHETVFTKKDPMTAIQWTDFFKTKVFRGTGEEDDPPYLRDGVLRGAIIPGTNVKSNNQWDVRTIIGFRTYDLYKPRDTTLAAKRNKPKHKGKSARQNNLRRGHRNRSRKAK